MSSRRFAVAYVLAAAGAPAAALNNGAAVTPPMGFNNYMAGLVYKTEMGLRSVADFFASGGMQAKGYKYVNTDEGWELKTRGADGKLRWDPLVYPSGLPKFISELNSKGFEYGIYGAASGVTCGKNPGQLYHEAVDADTYASWGVGYLKSDNCASYALDSSVRFGAMRDALNRTGRRIVFSIEPFSITPDVEQSVKVSNLARVAVDIRGTWDAFTDRADVSDKWAPLARPGYWNDPDMINLQNPQSNGGLTLGENRVYFGMWALMKAPLLLSSDLHSLHQSVVDIANNTAVIQVNQDPMGVQGRKLVVDGEPLPWLVGLESCTGTPATHTRSFNGPAAQDTRRWSADAAAGGAYTLRNDASGRCLAASNRSVVLLPCNGSDSGQQWTFLKGFTTVTNIVNVQQSRAGLPSALAVSNASLCGAEHKGDEFQVPDSAYGHSGLVLAAVYEQTSCSDRDCQNYDPSQMWYYDPVERMLRQSAYTASINHRDVGEGYTLTPKVPTWRHHCLAHVLSDGNEGTRAGSTEVWGGPLTGGEFAVALLNRGTATRNISVNWSMLGVDGVGAGSTFEVISLWTGEYLGWTKTGTEMAVPAHDVAMLRLIPQ